MQKQQRVRFCVLSPFRHMEKNLSTPPEAHLDKTLRPASWDEYVGQETIKRNVRILLEAARSRGHPPEHLLFYGPPGLGKTTLAYLIANELGAQLRATSGPAIERVGDLAAILSNLEPYDILFIDEIHRLPKTIEEVLYPALESGTLDLIIGKGPSARTVQLSLPPFTLIAATTRYAGLSAPLRSRFSGGTHRLEFYSLDEMVQILTRSAALLGITTDAATLRIIALRSRSTPRTANFLLKRVRDFAEVHNRPLDDTCATEALELLGVDERGLTAEDRSILLAIIERFGGGPVGLATLAAAVSEEEETIATVHEPYLMQLGFLERTPRGRKATPLAYQHLNITTPQWPLL